MNRKRVEPGLGQESVWDYPRPPRLEPSSKHIQVFFNAVEIANTTRAWRVLETSHPPVYYIPRDDIKSDALTLETQTTFCEFKGRAGYVGLSLGDKRVENAGWFYPAPTPAFADLKDCIAFYPSKMDNCLVDGETVRPQAGDFYGGWITNDIVGPFKGGAWNTGLVSPAHSGAVQFRHALIIPISYNPNLPPASVSGPGWRETDASSGISPRRDFPDWRSQSESRNTRWW